MSLPQSEATIVGSKPSSLLSHTTSKEYNIAGITPEEFININKHTGADFDFEDLKMQFKKHCDDYDTEIEWEKPSKAIQFCSKILYEVEPESRKVKKGRGNEAWKFVFNVTAAGTNVDMRHCVFVIRNFEGVTAQFKKEELYMVISIEQAGLLAMETFSRLVMAGFTDGYSYRLMTPRCGACFSKDDLKDFASAVDMTEGNLLMILNQSCQSGGQYLANSNASFAIVGSIATTRNCKDIDLRKSIVRKLTKQYIARGKMPDKRLIALAAPFATGGVPSEFTYEELIGVFEDEQKIYSALKRVKIMKDSEVRSRVDVPQEGRYFKERHKALGQPT